MRGDESFSDPLWQLLVTHISDCSGKCDVLSFTVSLPSPPPPKKKEEIYKQGNVETDRNLKLLGSDILIEPNLCIPVISINFTSL